MKPHDLQHPCRETCSGWRAGYNECLAEEKENYARLVKERDEYKRLAESWMADYDKMVEKYEPKVAVYSQEESAK